MPKAAATNRATNEVTLLVGPQRIELRILSGAVSDHGLKREEWINLPVLDEKTGKPKTQQVIVDGKKKRVPLTEDHKVGRGVTNKDTGELLTDEQCDQVAKKIQTEQGLVWLSDAEVEELLDIQPDTLIVRAFQPRALYDTREYVPDKPYFVEVGRDKKGKPLPNDGALLGALLATMEADHLIAVCELTTRGIPKPAILFSDGSLWQVWYTDALREGPARPEVSLDDATLTAVRSAMIEDLYHEEVLDLSDKRSELAHVFAEEKAANGDFAPVEDTYVKRERKDAEGGVDVLTLLGMSVEAAKAARKAS